MSTEISQFFGDFFLETFEKVHGPENLTCFASAHLSAESMAKKCALTFATLFKVSYGKI